MGWMSTALRCYMDTHLFLLLVKPWMKPPAAPRKTVTQTSHSEWWSLQAGAEQLGEGQQVAVAAGHILVTFYELSRLGSFPGILSSLSSLATPQAHGFLGEMGTPASRDARRDPPAGAFLTTAGLLLLSRMN